MKKIVLAIKDDFQRGIYSEILKQEGFETFEASDGKTLIDLVSKNIPDLILIDFSLEDPDGFEVVKIFYQQPQTKLIPLLLFSMVEKEKDKEKAVEIGVKDYIVGSDVGPKELALRIKTYLGFQKTYLLSLSENQKNLEKALELARDLRGETTLRCPKCDLRLCLFLVRDFSKGENYFKVSFTCQKCQ